MTLKGEYTSYEIEEIFQDVFVTDVSRLIYAAANEHCDGCEMDDLSQLHHNCLTMEVEEAWETHFEHVKGKVDLQKLRK